MSITTVVAIWAVLGVATLALALYRHLLAADEADVVRLADGEEKELAHQSVLSRKLGAIDRWGKTLTVITIMIGLGLAGAYGYKAWQDPSSVPNNFYMRTTPDR